MRNLLPVIMLCAFSTPAVAKWKTENVKRGKVVRQSQSYRLGPGTHVKLARQVDRTTGKLLFYSKRVTGKKTGDAPANRYSFERHRKGDWEIERTVVMSNGVGKTTTRMRRGRTDSWVQIPNTPGIPFYGLVASAARKSRPPQRYARDYLTVEMETSSGRRAGVYYRRQGEPVEGFRRRVYDEVSRAAQKIAGATPGGYAKVTHAYESTLPP